MGMLIEKTHTYWVRGYEYGYVLPKPINQGYVYTRYATINMVQQGIAQLVPYKTEWHIYTIFPVGLLHIRYSITFSYSHRLSIHYVSS
jgi:hypothetical protein